MATPVIISLLVGLVAGGAFMALWAANRIEEEGVRQFDRGFERGRWLTDISVAKAIEDQDRATGSACSSPAPANPAVHPPGHPVKSPARRCSSSPRGRHARDAAPGPVHADPRPRHHGGPSPPPPRTPGPHPRRTMPADLVAIAALAALAALAPLAADWRRRQATRRFDALYERNLLRRTGRG